MSDEEVGRTGRRNFMMATGALGVGAGMAMATSTPAAADTSPDVSTNAFSNVGPATLLNPGATVFWNFSFGGDAGFQIAGPNILQPFNGAVLTFFNLGKNNNNGGVTYFLAIRNDGGVTAVHNIQGGGVT